MSKIHWDRLKFPWSRGKDPVRFWLSWGGLTVFILAFVALRGISSELGWAQLSENVGGLGHLPPGYEPGAFNQPQGYYGPDSPTSAGQYFGYRSQDYYSPSQYGYYQQAPYYGGGAYGGYPGYSYGGGYNPYATGGPMYGGYGPVSPYYNPRSVPVFRGVPVSAQEQNKPQQPTQPSQPQSQPERPPPSMEELPSSIKMERSNQPPPPQVFESAPKKKKFKLSASFLYVVLLFAILLWLYLIYVMFKPRGTPLPPSKPEGVEKKRKKS